MADVNGWSNYETWSLALFLDEGLLDQEQLEDFLWGVAKQWIEGLYAGQGDNHQEIELSMKITGEFTKARQLFFVGKLSDDLLKEIAEQWTIGELSNELNLFQQQLLHGALDSIDYREVAHHLYTEFVLGNYNVTLDKDDDLPYDLEVSELEKVDKELIS